MANFNAPLPDLRTRLMSGGVIPAHPLVLNQHRKLDETRQAALTQYYIDAGSQGVAVGVHTTQFAIHDPKVGLYAPVLELAANTLSRSNLIRIAGVCGPTERAVSEATLAADLGYDCVLLSLGGLNSLSEDALIQHVKIIADVQPVMGFYLQNAVGGRHLSRAFWLRFMEIERVVAIKVAPFNRYQTLDVIYALAESGRRDIALYTGNDDTIVQDLVTTFKIRDHTIRFAGGLLGHWSVWTRSAVNTWKRCEQAVNAGVVPAELLTDAAHITEMNRLLFDADNHFSGCIAGIHDVLMHAGLMNGVWCLDANEGLSVGQAAALRSVATLYPHLSQF